MRQSGREGVPARSISQCQEKPVVVACDGNEDLTASGAQGRQHHGGVVSSARATLAWNAATGSSVVSAPLSVQRRSSADGSLGRPPSQEHLASVAQSHWAAPLGSASGFACISATGSGTPIIAFPDHSPAVRTPCTPSVPLPRTISPVPGAGLIAREPVVQQPSGTAARQLQHSGSIATLGAAEQPERIGLATLGAAVRVGTPAPAVAGPLQGRCRRARTRSPVDSAASPLPQRLDTVRGAAQPAGGTATATAFRYVLGRSQPGP